MYWSASIRCQKKEALVSLKKLLLYKGFIGQEKEILLNAIDHVLNTPGVGLLDWVLCLKSKQKNGAILTFDKKIGKGL